MDKASHLVKLNGAHSQPADVSVVPAQDGAVDIITDDVGICDGGASHPRIYLRFRCGQTELVCPYCSKRFRRDV